MIAIHHIKSLVAVPSAFDDSSYMTLEFTPEDGYHNEPLSLTLYFSPIEPGKLNRLCRAINQALTEPESVQAPIV